MRTVFFGIESFESNTARTNKQVLSYLVFWEIIISYFMGVLICGQYQGLLSINYGPYLEYSLGIFSNGFTVADTGLSSDYPSVLCAPPYHPPLSLLQPGLLSVF